MSFNVEFSGLRFSHSDFHLGHRDSQVQMSPRHGLRGHGAIKPLGQDFLCSHRFRTDRFPGTR